MTESHDFISECAGDLLADDSEALVNTVNTVGVMGKGIALQFKRAYPEVFKAYQAASRRGEIQLGHVQVVPTGRLTGNPRSIVNFPTKNHWRSKSRLSDIRDGLVDLVDRIEEFGIRSIAVPPLGCGNGGLRWSDVRPVIVDVLSELNDVEVHLYPPEGAPSSVDMRVATSRPKLTRLGRRSLRRWMATSARSASERLRSKFRSLATFSSGSANP